MKTVSEANGAKIKVREDKVEVIKTIHLFLANATKSAVKKN
jgi:hypothetical protein